MLTSFVQLVAPLLCVPIVIRIMYFIAHQDLRAAALQVPLLGMAGWIAAVGPLGVIDMITSAVARSTDVPAPGTGLRAAPATRHDFSMREVCWILMVVVASVLLALVVDGRLRAWRADAALQRATASRRAAIEADHGLVREQYGAYLADPLAFLDRPALDDENVPQTRALLTALDRADDASHGTDLDAYRAAVSALTQAWRTADAHATRTGLSHLTDRHRRVVAQARRLLVLALDERTPLAEGQQAYRTARSQLDGILALPAVAVAALEHVQRRALPAPVTDTPPTDRPHLTKP